MARKPKISKRELQLAQFKGYWAKHHSYITLELTDAQIIEFVEKTVTIEKACDLVQDYLLANGLADMQL